MDWFFDGLGTMLIGLVVGGAAGYRVGNIRATRQNQRAGDKSTQTQVGRDWKDFDGGPK